MGKETSHDDYRNFEHNVLLHCYLCNEETSHDKWETLNGRKAKKCRVCGFVTLEQMSSMW